VDPVVEDAELGSRGSAEPNSHAGLRDVCGGGRDFVGGEGVASTVVAACEFRA